MNTIVSFNFFIKPEAEDIPMLFLFKLQRDVSIKFILNKRNGVMQK